MSNAVVNVFRLALALGCVLVPGLSEAESVADKQSILRQAWRAYYDLRQHGLSGFRCDITPNWRMLLQQQLKDSPASTETALKLLGQLRFTVTLAADDSVRLEHNDIPGQNKSTMDALKQIYGGMEQLTSGFFDTWKIFMLAPPLPDADSDYDLQASGPFYRVTYKETDADVDTTMTKDFAVTNLSVTGRDFTSSIRPRFNRTPEGFVLAAYDASYRSAKPEEATELRVSADYQQLNGLQMLRKLTIAGTYGGEAFPDIELAFSGCKVTKK
jgi:hypothetical protein